MAVESAGKRFAPRVFEYRLTNSQTSRAYLLTACSSKCLMNIGAKHSLCLISMLSKMQPSESMPTNNGLVGLKSFKIWAGSLISIYDCGFTIDELVKVSYGPSWRTR